MRALWAKRIAFITGIVVILLAVAFALSQNPHDASRLPVNGYVGSDLCAKCHTRQYQDWSKSGHAFMLNKVQAGRPPGYPFTSIAQPPPGYQWQDILTVIGGYRWKARFIDQHGYLITGEHAQYNFADPTLDKPDNWVAYQQGQQDKPYDCGGCHTTGYHSDGVVETLPGIKGTWSETGIGCENCHGPGADHIKQPSSRMRIERSSQSCGNCHSRQPLQEISLSEGFIRHHQQFNSLAQGKHRHLGCVDCHDPHKGVIAEQKANRATVHTACQTCHQTLAARQTQAPLHKGLGCIDCHMPKLDVIAWRDPAQFSGDMRTHLFAIDPLAASQSTLKDGHRVSIPAITLDFACRSCHRENGSAADLPLEQLREFARGFHTAN